MSQVVDFNAARLEREKLIVAVAGLVDANSICADVLGVREFAFETRHWNVKSPDLYYRDTIEVLRAEHKAALAWAIKRLDDIEGWRDALFGRVA
jgi:hypothetical protein